ncbi:unnamed protein product [Rotaria magnacalcarata]|uniref:EF-hand domain-containing protein n=1 Tax=Rotaria magnacalcarata TaxID=392030 RepID=A0A816TX59_9BILA|nr:unnamed protein product [Rotaria magnacalcarata]CAF3963789.1 unnamed protein product [Rotaria magnacalcarata]
MSLVRRESTSSAGSSDGEVSSRFRDASEESKSVKNTDTFQRGGSVAKSIVSNTATETNTVGSGSPTISHRSARSTQKSFDTVSIQSGDSRSTKTTSTVQPTTTNSQQKQVASNTSTDVNKPIQIDVKSAQQQSQQRPVQSDVSPYSGSTSSYTDGSLSSPSSVSYQHQSQVNNTRTIPTNQTSTNLNSGANQQRPQYQQQTSGQFYHQQQQAQFVNQTSAQPSIHQIFGADDFKDVALNIDYGAIEAYNAGMELPDDFSAAESAGGAAGGGGSQFDVVKAIFNQVDTNRDGSISRQEFQQWAQQGGQNYGAQSHANYQAQPTATNYGNNFNHTEVLDGSSPQAMNILRQSGLGHFT